MDTGLIVVIATSVASAVTAIGFGLWASRQAD